MRFYAYYQRGFTGRPQPFSLKTHVHAATLEAENLEEVFHKLQAEHLAPEDAAALRARGTQHTSMSVGDVVIDELGHAHQVMPIGFRQLDPETAEERFERLLVYLEVPELVGTRAYDALLEMGDGHEVMARLEVRVREDLALAQRVLKEIRRYLPRNVLACARQTVQIAQQEERERAYQEHQKREGPGPVNMNPDGCWFCGSLWHMSSDCPERDEY